ncbi:PREDICTED: E3 ubiquitin-protein ligase RNF170-like [Branchiostoma belcheri]|uniref:E3 ubiquitin-protein ligase RNF170 n=1 Tax=Branchiostoma belcheri TaxID=7741 RepID=A0A6P4ZW57_BRABE|nr:PREDICTED: E3 ubiquitin-protein ligase RNF170-like [Branchiostoma belcheri]
MLLVMLLEFAVVVLVILLWLVFVLALVLALAVFVSIYFFPQLGQTVVNFCREKFNQYINSLPRAPPGRTNGTAGGTTGGYQNQDQTGSSGSEYSRPRDPGVSYDCPICLDRAKFATETNCGHVFCGPCILRYWDRDTRPVKCPYCRQSVTLLMKCFSEEDLRSPDQDSVSQQVIQYNRTFLEEPRGFITSLRDLPTILRHVWADMFSVGGLFTLLTWERMPVYLFTCALYLASPIDVLPEMFFGPLGLLDDAYVVIRLLIYVSNVYRRIVAEIEVD